jgi:hypothetical protein
VAEEIHWIKNVHAFDAYRLALKVTTKEVEQIKKVKTKLNQHE